MSHRASSAGLSYQLATFLIGLMIMCLLKDYNLPGAFIIFFFIVYAHSLLYGSNIFVMLCY